MRMDGACRALLPPRLTESAAPGTMVRCRGVGEEATLGMRAVVLTTRRSCAVGGHALGRVCGLVRPLGGTARQAVALAGAGAAAHAVVGCSHARRLDGRTVDVSVASDGDR